ncbi:MAG TPA: hypothetical protein VNH44_19605 [Micropepsaceae bacterium]|nr:hypothetical protein [Micropepsaceae bacterium]
MAKRPAPSAKPLSFRGTPRRLSLSNPELAGHECGEIVLPEELAAHGESSVIALPVRNSRLNGPSLKLRLDHATPAGKYQAQLRLSGKSVPVTLEIAPAPRLSVFPESANFAGKAGGESELDMTVVNKGNVAIELPERSIVGLFDDEGLEAAFAETYRQDTDDPVQLAGHWLRKLRDGYGGLLKLRIGSGSGSLPPDAERTIVVSAHLPENLKRGHSYHGIWEIGPVNYRVAVAVQR